MTLVAKVLRDVRAQIIGFGLTNAAMAFIIVLVYPSYSVQFADFELPAAFKAILGEVSLGTPQGFLTAEFFSWVPFLVITFAIMQGTYAVAGEEAAGTLDFLLAQPVRRWRFIVEKAAALAVGVLLITALSLPGFALGMIWVDLGIPLTRVAVAVMAMVPIALLIGMFSLWMGALLANRGAAAMAATGVTVAGYFVDALGRVVKDLEPLRRFSPFYYYPGGTALSEPFPYGDTLLLAVASLVCLAGALWSFQRREIAVGRREWSFGWALARRKSRAAP